MADGTVPHVLTVAEVAAFLRVSTTAVYGLINDGTLKSKTVLKRSHRIPVAEVERYAGLTYVPPPQPEPAAG